MWNLDEAISFVRELEQAISPVGFHCGIAGSVLTRGKSDDDLDLIVYPHSSGAVLIDDLYNAFDAFGLSVKIPKSKVASHWEEKGSSDMKNVEIWYTKDKKRIDVFHLR